MLNWFKNKPAINASPDLSTLVPRIKVRQFLAVFEQMDAKPYEMPYTEPIAGGLLLTYAFDLPEMFQMMNVGDMNGLGMSLRQLKDTAVANLKRIAPKIGATETSPVKQIVVGQNLEACVLLADRYWEFVAAEMEGEIVAVAPSRDHLLFCDSHSADGVAQLKTLAAEIMADAHAHTLSEQLIAWRGGRWMDCER